MDNEETNNPPKGMILVHQGRYSYLYSEKGTFVMDNETGADIDATKTWLPIEGAPRDGTPILLWDGLKQTVAWWGYDDLWNREPKKWIYGECYSEYNIYNTVDNPTH
jgi:hypothetical protein